MGGKIMNKHSFPMLAVAVLGFVALAACGTTVTPTTSAVSAASSVTSAVATIKNKDKPLIFFNRQPSNPDTGVIEMSTMNFSAKTFYVGFDAAGGGDVQGKMITDYLATKTKAELDKNSDGYLGYVLCIGDTGHNDSKARTKGTRKALGTLKDDSTDPDVKQEGSVTVKDGTLKVKELAAKAMTGSDGTTWNANAATEAMTTWAGNLGTAIDLVVSNNDGMAMGCLSSTTFPTGTPIFGYDANADAVEAIGKGTLTGTVSQNVDAQAMGVLQTIRNMFDGVTGDDIVKKGISEADANGNKITASMVYKAETKALLALNAAVTSANYTSYTKGTRDAGVKQLPASVKTIKLWFDLYNAGDNFLSSSYKPALVYYAKLLNIDLHEADGDGSSENSVSDYFINLDQFDAYAINLVKTNSGSIYTAKLAA
jgi:methyl-galactoside transport system substrate-binding protein